MWPCPILPKAGLNGARVWPPDACRTERLTSSCRSTPPGRRGVCTCCSTRHPRTRCRWRSSGEQSLRPSSVSVGSLGQSSQFLHLFGGRKWATPALSRGISHSMSTFSAFGLSSPMSRCNLSTHIRRSVIGRYCPMERGLSEPNRGEPITEACRENGRFLARGFDHNCPRHPRMVCAMIGIDPGSRERVRVNLSGSQIPRVESPAV